MILFYPVFLSSRVDQHTGRNFKVDDSSAAAAKKKFEEEFNFEENLKKLDLTKVTPLQMSSKMLL